MTLTETEARALDAFYDASEAVLDAAIQNGLAGVHTDPMTVMRESHAAGLAAMLSLVDDGTAVRLLKRIQDTIDAVCGTVPSQGRHTTTNTVVHIHGSTATASGDPSTPK